VTTEKSISILRSKINNAYAQQKTQPRDEIAELHFLAGSHTLPQHLMVENAEALLMRQLTLSRSIRQLEETIGVTVFERSSGGVCVTSAGLDFLRVARSILEQMDALVTSTHCKGRGEAGRRSVGFYTSLSSGTLRATLVDFRQRCPQVELGMVE
jgi:DNA-binding transcriptional LysR family regulator